VTEVGQVVQVGQVGRVGRTLLALGAVVLLTAPAYAQTASTGSQSLTADSCGVPATPPANATLPIFPPGQYPVSLPAASLLGARNDLPTPYRAGVHWGSLPDGRRWSSTASVTVAPDGTIWALDRCGQAGAAGSGCGTSNLDPILQFDPSGRLLKSFGRGMVVNPHKMTIDRAGNIWVTDIGRMPGKGLQAQKFSPNGTVLLALGKPGESGSGLDTFEAPTEVAIAPNGDIFVTDGHTGGNGVGNARIVKFDRTGKPIKAIGKKGMGPVEFDVPHTIAIDSRGRLFVGDRQNNRIQILDQDGRFIAQWFQFGRPSGIFIDRDDTIYVADSESRDGRTNTGVPGLPGTGYGMNQGARRGIRIGSARDGSVKAFIPDPCPYPYASASTLAEGVTADAQGSVYGADVLGTVRKFLKAR
jgi:sugar lactone lactonase YvrE